MLRAETVPNSAITTGADPHLAAPAAIGYSVDDLRIDLGRATVTRGVAELTVPGLTFDLLVALARHAPNIATTEALLQEVWPRVVVSPETLSQRVKLLREALGDDPQNPKYIASVRGRGYRLVPPVTIASAPPQDIAATESRPHRTRRASVLTVIAALIAAAVGGVMIYRNNTVPTATAPVSPLPRGIAVLPFRDLGGGRSSDVLALGIPEAVLHQLASQKQFPVISRTSSFAIEKSASDARDIGRRLNVRYLVEGSVQRDRGRLRVTAQLIDAESGDHVWSMQFDKAPQAVFELQDEIAGQVARALKISLADANNSPVPRAANANFDAYLEYLQGSRLLDTFRMQDMESAASHAERAIALEPGFAAAHVLLASARLRAAEFYPGDKRTAVFRDALPDVRASLDRAIALDPNEARAFAARGYLHAFVDPQAAESDYRKSLELNPNDSRAYEGLAALLFADLTRRKEAGALIDKAMLLDPLEPRLDVLKAMYLHYFNDDFSVTEQLLKAALAKNPLYQPALQRMAQLYWSRGRLADGVKISEQVVAADPGAMQAWQILQYLYFGIDDIAAAIAVAGSTRPSTAVLAAPALLMQKQWRAAGEAVYAAAAAGTIPEIGEPLFVAAIRVHARATGDYQRAIDLLANRSQTSWDEAGAPIVNDPSGLYCNVVALGDVLIAAGQTQRGRAVLEAALVKMDRDRDQLGAHEVWALHMRPVALALLGRDEDAMESLRQAVAKQFVAQHPQLVLSIDPALQRLRRDPAFAEVARAIESKIASERATVKALRASKLIPDRSH